MKDLTRGNIYKNFILFALPLMLSGLLSQSFAIVDTAIAGRYLGEDGIAAIAATASFIQLISSVMWGYCTGSSIYVAILFGAKDHSRLKSVVCSSWALLWVMGGVASAFFILVKDSLLGFLKVDPLILAEADRYFTVYVIGIVVIISNNFFVCALNALGSSAYPLYMSVLSGILNVAGNIFTVTVLKTGVIGVAISTVVSAAVADVFYVVKMLRIFKELGVEKERVTCDAPLVRSIFSYSIPCTIQQLVMYVSAFLVSPSINVLGKSATAAYSVTSRVTEVCASLYQNSSRTVSTYSSQSIGARKSENLKKGVKAGLIQSLVTSIPVIILLAVFARPVSLFFFEKGYEGKALVYAVEFARYFLPFIIFNALNNLFHSFWRGVTHTSFLILGTATGSTAKVVLTLILAPTYGMRGVFIAIAFSWIAEAVLNAALYLSGVWKSVLKKHGL